jgi:hypothetical protein
MYPVACYIIRYKWRNNVEELPDNMTLANCYAMDNIKVLKWICSSASSRARFCLRLNHRQPRHHRPPHTTVRLTTVRLTIRYLAVLTHHSAGVSSRKPGQLEVMLHRNLLQDDGRGLGTGEEMRPCVPCHVSPSDVSF